jgi:hypothetical protein
MDIDGSAGLRALMGAKVPSVFCLTYTQTGVSGLVPHPLGAARTHDYPAMVDLRLAMTAWKKVYT